MKSPGDGSPAQSSCFFCQNLLSDFLEGILPSSRHEEIKQHLGGCPKCADIYAGVKATIKLLKELPHQKVSPELSLRIAEAADSKRRLILSPRRFSRIAMMVGLPLVILVTLSAAFPNVIPLSTLFFSEDSEAQFTRYFPLLQGASEILEEQGTWIHSRETLMGSLWEEGGLSPEEFEKTFQIKAPKEPEK